MIELSDTRIQKYMTPYRYPKPVLYGSGNGGRFDSMAVDIPFVFRHQDCFTCFIPALTARATSPRWR